MALPELKAVDLGGTPIAIRDTETDKPPLVLLHGLGGSSQTWAFQFRALAEDFRVIAWDMPGYGSSGGFERENPTVEHYAHALSAVLDTIGAFKAHIVGQSVAALIGASYAAKYPDQALSYTFFQGLTGLAGPPDEERKVQRKSRLETFRELGAERFAEEVPPRLEMVSQFAHGMTLNLRKNKHRALNATRGDKSPGIHHWVRLEVEYKPERDGRFRDTEGNDDTSRREVFVGQTTVVISGLASGTRYRFRMRLGCVESSSDDFSVVTWGAYSAESVHATRRETVVEKDATARGPGNNANETKQSAHSQPVPVSSRETVLAALAAAEEAERVAAELKAEKKRLERLAAMTEEERPAAASTLRPQSSYHASKIAISCTMHV